MIRRFQKVVIQLRLLVTGGAGFIGSNFVRRQISLQSKWSSITVLDALTYAGNISNLTDCIRDSRYSFIQGNILNESLVDRLMGEAEIVVHFAAESHVDRSIQNPHQFVETNVLGTHVLLKSALENNVKTFIHVSTDEVYGSISEGSWPETHPINPNSPYSASKASSDLLAISYFRTYGMDVRVTRCSNNYGPHQYPEKLIPLFITNLIEGKKVPLYGSGLNIRDWLHVDDHCLGIELVIANGKAGEIYNIGGGTELTNLELTNKVLEKMGKGIESIVRVDDRKGHDLRYSVDISKSRETLGYEPRVDFEAGLAETIAWYQNNPQWWEPLKK
jgi:dTDP-glucose 4,6-dehydratase